MSLPALILQSLPLLVVRPFFRIARWSIFLVTWASVSRMLHPSLDLGQRMMGNMINIDLVGREYSHLRLASFFGALLFTAMLTTIIMPIIGIVSKWTIIGRDVQPALIGRHYIN